MPRPTLRALAWCSAALVAGYAMLTGCQTPIFLRPDPAPGSPTRAQIEQLVGQVRVVDARHKVPGYQRGCGNGEACAFGPAWTDDQDAPGGRDGCGTRDNVLALAFTDVEFKPGTRNCVVVAGTFADPFTGTTSTFSKSDAGAVQIDHTYPLAAAWDMGAATWPLPVRVRFANDVTYELMAVDGAQNQAKSDKTPGDWLPPNEAYHCFYVGRYLTVALRYGLPVTADDRGAITRVARGCG